MPTFEVNLTATGPCWFTTEADSEDEAKAAALEVGFRFLARDDDSFELAVDTVILEREL